MSDHARQRDREFEKKRRMAPGQQMQQKPVDSFLSVAQVAAALGNCCVRTVKRMIARGVLPSPCRVGRRLLIPREDFERFRVRLLQQRGAAYDPYTQGVDGRRRP